MERLWSRHALAAFAPCGVIRTIGVCTGVSRKLALCRSGSYIAAHLRHTRIQSNRHSCVIKQGHVAGPAVSSLEACTTPALQLTRDAIGAPLRVGILQPLTIPVLEICDLPAP